MRLMNSRCRKGNEKTEGYGFQDDLLIFLVSLTDS